MLAEMISWLLASLDPARAHAVEAVIVWHGRLMVAAWGVLLPLGVLIARFFKVTPRQDWPRALDSRLWWHGHLALQYTGGVLMLAGLGLLLWSQPARGLAHLHGILGYAVLAFGAMQFLAGWLRGTKGGPSEPVLRGDHYDMTRRRRIFERFHKGMGYLALLLACATIFSGLWQANAPRWMGLALAGWWLGLAAVFALLQRRGRAIDTYQAIWGPGDAHPGNRLNPIGWGVRRPPERGIPGDRP